MSENYCQAYTDSYMSRKFWQLQVLQKLTVTCHVFAKFAQAVLSDIYIREQTIRYSREQTE